MPTSNLNTALMAAALRGDDGPRFKTVSFGGGSSLVPQQLQHLSVGVPISSGNRGAGSSWTEGLAKVTDQLVSAMLRRRAMDDAEAEQRSAAEIGAAGLQMMRGRAAETRDGYVDPDSGEGFSINWNEQKPNVAGGLDYMMSSPTLAPKAIAMGLALQEAQARAQTEKDTTAFKEGFRFDPATGGVSALPGGWGDPAYQGRMAYSKSAGEAAGKFPYNTAEDTHKAQLEVWKANETPFTLNPGDTRFAGPGNTAPAIPLLMGAGFSNATPAQAGGAQTVPRPAAGGGPMSDVPLSPQARATIGVESGGNVDAASGTSSATGPAQFIDSTWLSMMQRHAPGLIQGKGRDEVLAMRSDPEVAGAMTDAYAKENDAALRAAGLEPTPADLHFAHTFGAGGAVKMLTADPRATAATLNSRSVVEANRGLFFEKNGRPRTVAELRQVLGDRFGQNLPQDAAAQDMAAGLADPGRALPPGDAIVPDVQAVASTMPVMQPPAAGAAMPQMTPPGTADAMPNPAAPRGVQVAQANTGTMTDAAPIGVSSQAGQPNGPRIIAQGGPRPNANFDKLKADTVGGWQGAAEQGATTLNLVNQMQDILDRGFTPGAGAQNMATAARVMQGLGIPADIVSSFYNPADAKAFENASNQMVLSIVKGLGPNPSNADRDFIERTVPLLRDTPEAISEVMGRIRERAAGNVARFRLGYEHAKAGGDPLEFDTQWNTRQTKSLDGQTYYKIGGKWYAAGN